MEEGYSKRKSVKGISQLQLAAEIGKMPPQATDLEEAVLGAVLLEKNALGMVIDFLKPESFYKEPHQHIWAAILSLNIKHEPIDILMVTKELRALGTLDLAGGPYYISMLTNKVSSSANLEFHSMVVQQKFLQRELIRISTECIKDAYEDTTDVKTLMENFQSQAYNLNNLFESKIEMTFSKQVDETIKEIKAAMSGTIVGIKTGNPKLDLETGGWHKQNLIVIAGRPGSGKTSRAISFMLEALKEKKTVFVFSVEMSYREVIKKMIANNVKINTQDMLRGRITDDDFNRIILAGDYLKQQKIQIFDKAAITTSYIRKLCMKGKPDLIIVDYLQIIKPETNKNRNRENEIASISIELKSIAKEVDCPLIVLSQLSRECEKRSDKRPIMSDIRESGQIEQDSDMIMALYRPSYYYQYEKREKQYGDMPPLPYAQASELHILKHRHGVAGIYMEEYFDARINQYTSEYSQNETARSTTAPF
jgi:replicative DNA helicase